MHRRLFVRGVAVVALLGAAAVIDAPGATAESPPSAVTDLRAAIDTILADSRLTGAQAGVVVVDTTTGETLYDRNGDRRLVPASNTKLLTSTAALEILGPDHRFTTEVRAAGARTGPLLRGDLHLRGTGDPTMLADDYDRLAAAVAATGLREVSGGLVADDTWFDDRRLGNSWTWDDEPYYYAAQVSALTVAPDTDYDAGTVIVHVAPGATAGAKPVVTMTPPNGYLTVDNRAATTAAGGTGSLAVERRHGDNTVVVTGQIPVGAPTVDEWVTVWEPTGYAADVFRRALARHGVRVWGSTTLGRATPAAAATLAAHRSMTLAELMVPFMKLSNNGHAEVLTKSIGRATAGAGTWPAGLAGIAGYVSGAGMDPADQRQDDGSGLSRRTVIPPRGIADLLVAARAEPWFPAWYAALPIAGEPDRLVGGTLRNRMRGTPAAGNVHAKTGTLTGVSGLSGYVTSADGRLLVFSIVLNNQLAPVTAVQDRIAVALASWDGTAGLRAVPAAPQRSATTPVPDDLECSWVKPVTC